MDRRHAIAVLLASAANAHAADLLALPSLPSRRAARALMLGIARAGNDIVAVGERGIVLYSTDGGTNWHQATVPVSVTLTAVHFPTPTHGFAVGHDGVILASRDGGRKWELQYDGKRANELVLASAERRLAQARDVKDEAARKEAEIELDDARAAVRAGASRPLLSVWFRYEREGYAVGSYGQIFRTTDAGKTWEYVSAVPNPDRLHYNAITQTPGGTLVIAGEAGRVYRSSNKGASWQRLDTGYKGHLYGVLGVPTAGRAGETLLAFGFGGNVFRLGEDGRSWERPASGARKSLVGGAVRGATVVLACQDGGLVISRDGGMTMHYLPGDAPLPLSGIALVALNQIAVAGFGGARVVSSELQKRVLL
ncbi:MAG TPA: YCF48-related protein [Ramlibacter sp.]|nr:YCF48-related protein [Ramlibacter sp.]